MNEPVPPKGEEEDSSLDRSLTKEDGETSPPTPPVSANGAWFFRQQVHRPTAFMFVLPIILIILAAVGWSRDDIVEEEVNNIWIPTRGDYASDVDYAESVGGSNDLPTASFAAMAISRDGDNLLTPTRLEEIRKRMEYTEGTTIQYPVNGEMVTFTWEDMCATNNAGKGTVYQFPCARLSPMDYFLESRWFFEETDRVTWYDKVLRERLVEPRIPRFGVLTGDRCATPTLSGEGACDEVIRLRRDPSFAEEQGYGAAYARPLSLFSDIGNLEMSDPCRICYETEYPKTIDDLYNLVFTPTFGLLAQSIQATLENPDLTLDDDTRAVMTSELQTLGAILATVTRSDVEEFYSYYVARGVYAELGVDRYLAGYTALTPFLQGCAALGQPDCPPIDPPTRAEASAALANHADSIFSSISTAGAPFPFWSSEDGTGVLFQGSEPVSGSGVDMSANLFSMVAFLDLQNARDPSVWNPFFVANGPGYPDPTNEAVWSSFVTTNPLYAWFRAGLEPAEAGTICNNLPLSGSQTGNAELDGQTAFVMANQVTQKWCTPYDIPNSNTTESSSSSTSYTRQHFARMWYDLLIASDGFLGVTQGIDDPYSWTTGQGCGYNLAGSRTPYTNQTEEATLLTASGDLYYIDEGETVGVVDRSLIMGGVVRGPEVNGVGNLTKVTVIQSLYASLTPNDIPARVANCNRPGGPVDITVEDAEEILEKFKEAFEDRWSEDFDDDDAGEVQFVSFFDDTGVVGTTGRILRDITLDNGTLTIISILIIAVFSAAFLFSIDQVESRVGITLLGVTLVVLAYFGAIGFALLIGIKLNITIAWTLPFIILGLGVDDMYIVLMAIKKQRGYGEHHFLFAMKEVVVPVTMTSLVNVCMFGILTISDIPAVYITAQVAACCVVALYLVIIVTFPAFCYLDLKRQAAGRRDIFFCFKRESAADSPQGRDYHNLILYDYFYKPIVLGSSKVRLFTHTIIWIVALVLVGLGIWGITEREIGLGLEDFFPLGSAPKVWAEVRTEDLGSWSIGINWGALDYADPDTQLKMVKQFEDVVATRYVAETDTERLWMADLLVWTTRMCEDDFVQDSSSAVCGRTRLHEASNSTCEGTWRDNEGYGLRERNFVDPTSPTCNPYVGGICRPASRMHVDDLPSVGLTEEEAVTSDKVFCPVIEGWSDDKWQFCMREWRNGTNYSGGQFLLEEEHGSETECQGEYNRDENIAWPIKYTSGPTMFAFDLTSHQKTLDMMEMTREVCDENEELHCWMTGIPFDYWTQYEGIFTVLLELAGYSSLVGFGVSLAFLLAKLLSEKRHPAGKVFCGSLIGALFITATILMSLVSVVGLSILAGVSLTGFSNMSFVLSVGFSVEYSVHVVAGFLRCRLDKVSAVDRVGHTMSFLVLPTFCSFVSSTIGVVVLAFTEFGFVHTFFFRPLIIVMFVTYFMGCWWLPALLCLMDFDIVKLGKLPSEEVRFITPSIREQAGDIKTGGRGVVSKEPADTPSKADDADVGNNVDSSSDSEQVDHRTLEA